MLVLVVKLSLPQGDIFKITNWRPNQIQPRFQGTLQTRRAKDNDACQSSKTTQLHILGHEKLIEYTSYFHLTIYEAAIT